MGDNEEKMVRVSPTVIEKLGKIQGFYAINGKKLSYGKIVEKLVSEELSSLSEKLEVVP